MNKEIEHEDEASEWHLRLFRKSLLKQEKLQRIRNLLGSSSGMVCLDVGGDNGVISYFLRRDGGTWTSVDMSEKAVASMGRLLGEENVHRIEGAELPFDDDVFDAIVIIDYLEHIEEDYAFVQECHRVLKPSGILIANVPHVKKLSLIRMCHKLLGLTDEMHGHVRPGYSTRELYDLLKDGFDITDSLTYSRFFVQLIDTGIQFMNSIFNRGGDKDDGGGKGVMIDEDDFSKYQRAFRLYGLIYPLIWLASKLDLLLFWTKGHSLIVRARSRPWKPRRGVKIADGRSIAEASLNTKIGTAAPF